MNLKNISTESLTNGEKISLGCIEITTIPHSSIISGTETQETIVERYKIEFESLLNEVFQTYKSISLSRGYSADISVELLWKTTPVQDQPYNANIRLFIIVRAISSQKESSERDVSTVIRLFESTLTLQKYEYTDVEYSTLHQMICTIDS